MAQEDRSWVSYGDANYLDWGGDLARRDWGTCYEVLHVETEGPAQETPKAYLCFVDVEDVALGGNLDHQAVALFDWMGRGDLAADDMPPEAAALLAAVEPAELATEMVGYFGVDEFQPRTYHANDARLTRDELADWAKALEVPETLLANAQRHMKAGR